MSRGCLVGERETPHLRRPRLSVRVSLQHRKTSIADEQHESRAVFQSVELRVDITQVDVGSPRQGRYGRRNVKVAEESHAGVLATSQTSVIRLTPQHRQYRVVTRQKLVEHCLLEVVEAGHGFESPPRPSLLGAATASGVGRIDSLPSLTGTSVFASTTDFRCHLFTGTTYSTLSIRSRKRAKSR